MAILAPTPPERMVDPSGRPYFLWDSEMDLETFRARLLDADEEVRGYYIGKLMRQAKPDDVFTFIDLATIRTHWTVIAPYLGRRREMWEWLLAQWSSTEAVERDG